MADERLNFGPAEVLAALPQQEPFRFLDEALGQAFANVAASSDDNDEPAAETPEPRVRIERLRNEPYGIHDFGKEMTITQAMMDTIKTTLVADYGTRAKIHDQQADNLVGMYIGPRIR